MRKITIVLLCSLAYFTCKAQTYFWTETWSGSVCVKGCTTYTGPNGAWNINNTLGANGTKANVWFFSKQEQGQAAGACGAVGFPISAHIGNVSGSPLSGFFCPLGDCGAAYDAGLCNGKVISHTRLESPVINCTGESTITLSFTYITKGDAADGATVYWFDGTTWFTLPVLTPLTCGVQGKWENYSTVLPAGANNNPNVQVGFYWVNDDDCLDAGDADPSVAIYNVQLSVPVVAPISLLDFEANYNKAGNNVYLNWSTATETNNHFFTIERSDDGESFEPITTVQGAGNSFNTKYYSAIDNGVSNLSGTLYYRLKQTDYDGKYSYSKTVAVDIPDSKTNALYPNPASSKVSIDYYSTSPNESINYSIYDCTGKKVSTANLISTNAGVNTYLLNVSTLPGGLYIIDLVQEGESSHFKFIKE